MTDLGGTTGAGSPSEHGLVLRAVPFGERLFGHTQGTLWGVWGQVGERAVLATAGRDASVLLWDAERGTVLHEPAAGHPRPLLWGRWGRVGGRPVLAAGDADGAMILWDAEQSTPLPAMREAHRALLRWGEWGLIGGRAVLAAGGDDGTVLVWYPERDLVLAMAGHRGKVTWGAWGTVRGRPCLATGCDDGTVRLWDAERGSVLGEPLAGHVAEWGVWGRAGGRPVLATGGGDGTVRLWDAERSIALPKTPGGPYGAPSWGAWGQVGGQPVLAITDTATVRLWDAERGIELPPPLGNRTDARLWGAWARVGGRSVLATGGLQGSVRLWDAVRNAALEDTLADHVDTVLWGAWGRVDRKPVLATGGNDRFVRLWEVIEDRRVSRLPSYQSDVTKPVVDELSRLGDAVALAELVTARTVRPPMAVGLFGHWGEGKTHFLELLHQQVATARPDNPLSCSAVRQVRFNAWHYAETDLWASLVAELFAQLAEPPDRDVGKEQRQQSRLAADVVAQRKLRERLQAARARRDELEAAVRRAEQWQALPEEHRELLTQLAGQRGEKRYDEAEHTVASVREAGRLAWGVLRSRPVRLAAPVLTVAAVAGLVAWLIPSLERWSVWAAVAAAVGTAIEIGRRIAAMAKYLGSAWEETVRIAEGKLEGMQTAADMAAAEVAALEGEMQDLTAAGQLAGLVAERAKAGSYRGQLGVMTQIREDFERMASLLTRAAEPGPGPDDTDAVGDELPRIDRIILYVDDLDRCPPRRVVEMLEAIHLLLAAPLFVTVVAVDPRWLLQAIAAQYPVADVNAEPADSEAQELWQSTPAQYLEKIFQVILTLPPLDTGGYQRLLRTLVTSRQSQATSVPTAAGERVGPAAGAVACPTAGPLPDDGDEAEIFGVRLPAGRADDRVDPLTLEPEELALLDLLGPPRLVSTPRAVKRLANSYGLLTAMRRDHRAADLDEQRAIIRDRNTGAIQPVVFRPYRAGMTLLAALVAFPALGPALFMHLHHMATDHPDQPWARFLEDLDPAEGPRGWHNAAAPSMTAVQAQQWQALLDGLRITAEVAAEHGLPLPGPLRAWQEWVVPVGRLSFPTGHVIRTLDRHLPLPGRPAGGRYGAASTHPEQRNGRTYTVIQTSLVACGSAARTDEDRRILSEANMRIVRTTMESMRDSCSWQDRGDGLLIAVAPGVSTLTVMECLLGRLPAKLRRHNRTYADGARIQLRVAVDVGPVIDDMGFLTPQALGTSGLIEAAALKTAMAESGTSLGIIISESVYLAVTRHGRDPVDPARFTFVRANVKESSIAGWMQVIA